MDSFWRGVGVFGLMVSFAATSVAAESAAGKKPGAAGKPAGIERGKYLVNLGGCNDCHTPKLMTEKGPVPDTKRLLSGFPSSEKAPAVPAGVIGPASWGGLFTNDLTGWAGPWGVSFASNITPDKETGIGAWTEATFIKTLRTGTTPGGRRILPPMPWEAFREVSDADMKAIYAHLVSLPPVRNMVPAPVPPK
jgi:cytochrome c553